jgi:lysophospholipase L1-like esterase
MEKFKVLCFGDSNTAGYSPTGGVFETEKQWPVILGKKLGKGAVCFSDGVGGRRVGRAWRSFEPVEKNGYFDFIGAVERLRPDLVIIMLGTNDAQIFNQTEVSEIVGNLQLYVDKCREFKVRCILVAPVVPRADFIDAQTGLSAGLGFNVKSMEILRALPMAIRQLARKNGVGFLDAHEVARVGADGVHGGAASHWRFAVRVAGEV